ncbi:hypothetical protein [Hydrogenophaga sp.]|uniref:hypothetical protein n=1 Tax=Hydrogenophaga sp. TaxID=1904254 RepID=UPI0035AF585E
MKDGEIRYGQLDGHALKEGRLDARVAANTPEGVSHDGLVRADLPVARQRDTQWEYATTALTPPPWQRA